MPSAGSQPGSLLVQSGTAPLTASSCSILHQEEVRDNFLSYAQNYKEGKTGDLQKAGST